MGAADGDQGEEGEGVGGGGGGAGERRGRAPADRRRRTRLLYHFSSFAVAVVQGSNLFLRVEKRLRAAFVKAAAAAELPRPPLDPGHARVERPARQQQLGAPGKRQGLLPELRPGRDDPRQGRVHLPQVVDDERLDQAPQARQGADLEGDLPLQGLDALAAVRVEGVERLDGQGRLDPRRRGEERRGGDDAEAEGPRARAAAARAAARERARARARAREAVLVVAAAFLLAALDGLAGLLLVSAVSVSSRLFSSFFLPFFFFFSSLELLRVVVDNVDVLEGSSGKQGAEPCSFFVRFFFQEVGKKGRGEKKGN